MRTATPLFWLLVIIGLALSLWMALHSQVMPDQINQLGLAWKLLEEGEWLPFGVATSAGGKTPGGRTRDQVRHLCCFGIDLGQLVEASHDLDTQQLAAVLAWVVVEQRDLIPARLRSVDRERQPHSFGVSGAAQVERLHPARFPVDVDATGSARSGRIRCAAPVIQSLQS